MADWPILFSAPMVRALLSGTKTQTRRVLSNNRFASLFNGEWADTYVLDPGNASWREKDVRFAVGDRLYVREAWSGLHAFHDTPPAQRLSAMTPDGPLLREDVWFWADGDPDGGDYEKPRPGMHMPRWASRLTLIVTDVRVQRLREISRDDAIAEGLIKMPTASAMAVEMGCDWGFEGDDRYGSPVSSYAALWNSLNADRGFGWDANPWIVAVTFEVKHGNIDQIGGSS